MIKRSNAIKLVLLGTGAVAVYSATSTYECRPMTAGVLTNGWRIDSTDPTRECRSRSWRSSGSSSHSWGYWGGGSSSSSSSDHRSSSSTSTASHQTTTSRGGFGGSGAFHSSGS